MDDAWVAEEACQNAVEVEVLAVAEVGPRIAEEVERPHDFAAEVEGHFAEAAEERRISVVEVEDLRILIAEEELAAARILGQLEVPIEGEEPYHEVGQGEVDDVGAGEVPDFDAGEEGGHDFAEEVEALHSCLAEEVQEAQVGHRLEEAVRTTQVLGGQEVLEAAAVPCSVLLDQGGLEAAFRRALLGLAEPLQLVDY